MDSHILIKFPSPIRIIKTERIIGNTNRETKLLSSLNYLKTKNYSTTYIEFQLSMMDYSIVEIQKAYKKI